MYNKKQGYGDSPQLSTASSTAQIVEHRLNGVDEHLILASQGLWNVVSPDDAALRLHFHLKVKLLSKWIRLDQQCCLSCVGA